MITGKCNDMKLCMCWIAGCALLYSWSLTGMVRGIVPEGEASVRIAGMEGVPSPLRSSEMEFKENRWILPGKESGESSGDTEAHIPRIPRLSNVAVRKSDTPSGIKNIAAIPVHSGRKT
jgi:hypothetical protein